MATLKFQFAVIDAPDHTFIKGVALLDANGQRIGQIIAVPVADADMAGGMEAIDLRSSQLPAGLRMVGESKDG